MLDLCILDPKEPYELDHVVNFQYMHTGDELFQIYWEKFKNQVESRTNLRILDKSTYPMDFYVVAETRPGAPQMWGLRTIYHSQCKTRFVIGDSRIKMSLS